MHLFDNDFNGHREIKGYNKDKILEIKEKLLELKSEKSKAPELKDFLNSEFKSEVITLYSDYFKNIKKFSEENLFPKTQYDYYSLKSAIISELELILNNLANLSSNIRNIKRMIKNGDELETYLLDIKSLTDSINDFLNYMKGVLIKSEKEYENEINLWNTASKIKNLNYKLNSTKDRFGNWSEVQDLTVYLKNLIQAKTGKKIKGKEIQLTFHFEELFQFFQSISTANLDAYKDFIFLLFRKNLFEEFKGDEFINVLERKEVVQQLREAIRPIIISLIKDKLQNHLEEIKDLDEKYDLTGYGHGKLDLEELLELKFSEFLPKLVDFYFKGLDKRFQSIVNDIGNPEEFINVANSCYDKIGTFATQFDDVDTWVLNLDNILKPYDNITATLKKTIANLTSEIIRRKEEYLNYVNSIRDEGLRVDIRSYVDEKIAEVNKLISAYEDKTSVIIREELPQLREIKDLLTEYKSKIDSIKEEVYIKLEAYKEHNVDMYNIIKHWEDNFNRKKQQLTFLLTVLINKIFKSFKDLIDTESILFAEINEITKQTESFEGLPLNFALSSFLANRLSEDELKERISEINAKINQLNSSLGLYQVEMAKIEEILVNKVKIRKGVSASNVQCTVCHKNINFAKDKLITCPFCGSTYHYLCVAQWLTKYNSCPMCQNQFLDPNLGLFESE